LNTRNDAPAGPLHLTVHGRVQGVGYRQGMENVATGLGVCGWVRNCHDGTVEAVIAGSPQGCAALVRWARRGPLAATVHHVEVRPASAAEAGRSPDAFRCLANA